MWLSSEMLDYYCVVYFLKDREYGAWSFVAKDKS